MQLEPNDMLKLGHVVGLTFSQTPNNIQKMDWFRWDK